MNLRNYTPLYLHTFSFVLNNYCKTDDAFTATVFNDLRTCNGMVVVVDPCLSLPDGDYPLDERFKVLLPGVNARCNFVKCAHRSSFINACSRGTRNPEHHLSDDSVTDQLTTGAHYCSVRDVEKHCEHQYYQHHNADDDEEQLLNYPQLQPANVKHYFSV